MRRIYKILPRTDWEAAQAVGRYEGSVIDVFDGFIHFSTADQAQETATKHFAGKPDLIVLEVDADDLGEALRWEPSRRGQLFPHLYGPLDPALVRGVTEAPLDAEDSPQVGTLA